MTLFLPSADRRVRMSLESPGGRRGFLAEFPKAEDRDPAWCRRKATSGHSPAQDNRFVLRDSWRTTLSATGGLPTSAPDGRPQPSLSLRRTSIAWRWWNEDLCSRDGLLGVVCGAWSVRVWWSSAQGVCGTTVGSGLRRGWQGGSGSHRQPARRGERGAGSTTSGGRSGGGEGREPTTLPTPREVRRYQHSAYTIEKPIRIKTSVHENTADLPSWTRTYASTIPVLSRTSLQR